MDGERERQWKKESVTLEVTTNVDVKARCARRFRRLLHGRQQSQASPPQYP
jgi:hypothetical protein